MRLGALSEFQVQFLPSLHNRAHVLLPDNIVDDDPGALKLREEPGLPSARVLDRCRVPRPKTEGPRREASGIRYSVETHKSTNDLHLLQERRVDLPLLDTLQATQIGSSFPCGRLHDRRVRHVGVLDELEDQLEAALALLVEPVVPRAVGAPRGGSRSGAQTSRQQRAQSQECIFFKC